MSKALHYIGIGAFTMESSDMRVSDPSYTKDVWCCGVIPDCLPGTWKAAVTYGWEGRVARLVARHESRPSFDAANAVKVSDRYITYGENWTVAGFTVGVDSGQAGLFDDLHYGLDESVKDLPDPSFDVKSLFYGHCCDTTSSEDRAGVIPFGAVSSSGFGDGSYTALFHKNADGHVDMVVIIFLEDE